MDNRRKMPFVTKEQLDAICERFPTPFHLYDEKGIRENARRLMKAFSWNKGFKEYFAVKATPTPAILKLLREEGCGVDCSSIIELKMSEKCGFSGKEIMFSANDTPAGEFAYCTKLGGIINFDDYTHIAYYEKNVGALPDTVCCRYNPGGDFLVTNDIMDTPGDAKYGMTYDQLVDAFHYMQSKGVKKFGIHAFLASNVLADEYYPMLARVMFDLAVRLKRDTGIAVSFVNLSGGIGVPYKPKDKPCNIDVIGEGVRRAYNETLVPEGMGDVAIFTELGRFMLAPYGCLVSRAIHQKHIYKEYIGLDACAADLMRPAMYGAYHHITVSGKEQAPLDHLYDVTGSLCENNDKFAVDRALPKIDIGDLLIIHDTGAHGHAMGYNYNGKLRSAEILLREDGSATMIRRAETEDDYFATTRDFYDAL